MPELVLEEAAPPAELTGAGGLLVLVHPASQSETSERAAIRLTVNLVLPRSFIPEYVNCQYLAYRAAPGQTLKMRPPYA
ncbi:hypothetical protein [Klebsiella variicola]|uniref:hypothetical protein n=1 Tax=Klebsiella variicola TaxID=244366 RepID=UPI001D113174|nr:hypothetical protein [Klebsiella variicola]